MPAVEEKKNGAPKPEKTVEKKADGEKRQRPRNRRRGAGAKKEGENGAEKKPAADKKKADGEKKQGEKKPKADAEKDGDKPKRQRNRRRGVKKAEDGEKKPAEKKESKPADGEKKEGGDKRRRNRRRPRKNDTAEEGDKATSEKKDGEKPKRRRDRRKRTAPGEKAGITADLSEEELKGLSAIKVTNYPHFLSHKDTGVFFRTLAPLLTEGVQLSYEVLPEEEVKALGEPAAAAVKKTEGEEGEKKNGRSNNRRELPYKDRFDYWTSPEGAVKYRLVYLYPTAAGTADELVKKINATKSLTFEFTERLKEITQFTHTEEKSTVELPKALEATKITWADVPSYVQKPTAKPE